MASYMNSNGPFHPIVLSTCTSPYVAKRRNALSPTQSPTMRVHLQSNHKNSTVNFICILDGPWIQTLRLQCRREDNLYLLDFVNIALPPRTITHRQDCASGAIRARSLHSH